MASNTKKTHKKKTTSQASSKKATSSIEKIKANEKKYTIILVTIFFLSFCFIGYQTLQINSNYVVNSNISNNQSKHEVTLAGKTITLTNKNIKSDSEGLLSDSLLFSIENNQNHNIHYQIILKEDDDLIQECGCINKRISYTSIHYSLDGKNVKTINPSEKIIILEDNLNKNSTKEINLKIWLSKNLDLNTENHFHGKLEIEII